MKQCSQCGAGFVGFADRCDVCRRRGVSVIENVKPTEHSEERCPACGHKLRKKRPLTNAERQRRYRERKRDIQKLADYNSALAERLNG